MKKVDYLVTAKCEALYEYANSVMAKYEDYLDSESALDCIKNIYDRKYRYFQIKDKGYSFG